MSAPPGPTPLNVTDTEGGAESGSRQSPAVPALPTGQPSARRPYQVSVGFDFSKAPSQRRSIEIPAMYARTAPACCLRRPLSTTFPDLDNLRAAFWAPSSKHRMNASAAPALDVECGSHWIGTNFVILLCRLIFDHDDGVHGEVTIRTRFFMSAPCLEGRGASCAFGYDGALGSRCPNYGRMRSEMQGRPLGRTPL